MTASVLHVASAILRRTNEIVLVHQGAPREGLHWSLPGGMLEPGELLSEGLAREVLEETGLEIRDLHGLAFVVQIENRRLEQLHASRGAGTGYLATVWIFEAEWTGELRSEDPEGLVASAEFVAIDEACRRLEQVPWHSPTARYLRGEVQPGTLYLQRWHADGHVEHIATITS